MGYPPLFYRVWDKAFVRAFFIVWTFLPLLFP